MEETWRYTAKVISHTCLSVIYRMLKANPSSLFAYTTD
jgi:hypothetical protein